jgi:hypothetical protein
MLGRHTGDVKVNFLQLFIIGMLYVTFFSTWCDVYRLVYCGILFIGIYVTTFYKVVNLCGFVVYGEEDVGGICGLLWGRHFCGNLLEDTETQKFLFEVTTNLALKSMG